MLSLFLISWDLLRIYSGLVCLALRLWSVQGFWVHFCAIYSQPFQSTGHNCHELEWHKSVLHCGPVVATTLSESLVIQDHCLCACRNRIQLCPALLVVLRLQPILETTGSFEGVSRAWPGMFFCKGSSTLGHPLVVWNFGTLQYELTLPDTC